MLKPALSTFVQVCRSGSFTKAAAVLYVTPSAVMQQMDALERDFGTALLVRSHQGVKPTEAGAYLLEEAEAMQRRASEVRERVRGIAAGDGAVCVGTSLLERCRLLYDLWTLYSQDNPASRIQMVNLSAEADIPECAELIESLNSGVSWMRAWDFFEICRVPFGIAIEPAHPLAQRPLLRPADLAGEAVVGFRFTADPAVDGMVRRLEAAGAQILWRDIPSPSIFSECVFHHRALLAPMCWSDILAGLTLRPVDWPFTVPYGIFSRPRPRPEVARFMRFIRGLYAGSDPDDIVPMLNY